MHHSPTCSNGGWFHERYPPSHPQKIVSLLGKLTNHGPWVHNLWTNPLLIAAESQLHMEIVHKRWSLPMERSASLWTGRVTAVPTAMRKSLLSVVLNSSLHEIGCNLRCLFGGITINYWTSNTSSRTTVVWHVFFWVWASVLNYFLPAAVVWPSNCYLAQCFFASNSAAWGWPEVQQGSSGFRTL